MSRAAKDKQEGGLGVRYGRTLRKRYTEIKRTLKVKHYCQKCGRMSVKRVSIGIWKCRKCGFTFTGGAYSPTSKVGDMVKRTLK